MAERIPALLVTDPAKAAEFYTEVFGMTIVLGAPQWVLALGASKVRLIEAARADLELGVPAEAGKSAARLMATNINLLHERADLHKTVARKQRLRRTRWGTDEFTATDLDGNTITFWSVTVT
jgi:catechol 2,3-dioxygenase-like lactoylglutathione lyase family enzyme